MKHEKVVILGAGVTGLSAAFRSGYPVYEASERAGGVCRTYYHDERTNSECNSNADIGRCFRFEVGGGHWIHSRYKVVLDFINELTPIRVYQRRAEVWLRAINTIVPYPLQHNIDHLPKAIRSQVTRELNQRSNAHVRSMEDWLLHNYGPTLHRLFFEPFHNKYTGDRISAIQPPEQYKNLSARTDAEQGHRGYNSTFAYPIEGVGAFTEKLAALCDVRYSKRVVEIHGPRKTIRFSDGTSLSYDAIISTIPLNQMMRLVGSAGSDNPHTSIMVLNIGGVKGPLWRNSHWVYLDHSDQGIHRFGSYSNVARDFLPLRYRENHDVVSLYVEKTLRDGVEGIDNTQEARDMISEIQSMGLLNSVIAADVSIIETAYTWKYVDSNWVDDGLHRLSKYGITQAGRFAEWNNQGIADSIVRGLEVGRKESPSGYSVKHRAFEKIITHENEELGC